MSKEFTRKSGIIFVSLTIHLGFIDDVLQVVLRK